MLITHLNARNLAKNKKLIKEFISEIDYLPEVIGISKTKLNVNACLNLNIPILRFFTIIRPPM